ANHWFRATVCNETDISSLILLLDYNAMDEVDIYFRRSSKREKTIPWTQFVSGDQRTFDSRPIPFVAHAFPIHVLPGESVDVVFRAQTRGNMIVPFWVMTQERFDRDRLILYTVFGGVFGILLIT